MNPRGPLAELENRGRQDIFLNIGERWDRTNKLSTWTCKEPLHFNLPQWAGAHEKLL